MAYFLIFIIGIYLLYRIGKYGSNKLDGTTSTIKELSSLLKDREDQIKNKEAQIIDLQKQNLELQKQAWSFEKDLEILKIKTSK